MGLPSRRPELRACTLIGIGVLVLLVPSPGDARQLAGHLTGEFPSWGPSHVEAFASRDLTEMPVATAPVRPDGAFDLSVPDVNPAVYLAIWADAGSPYPWLLRATPVPTDTLGLRVPVTAPPSERADRQSRSAGSWAVFLAAMAGLVLTLVLLRRWLSRRSGTADRLVPPPAAVVTLWPSLVALLPVAALLGYGVFVLDEPFDLLEYTYFQEAFAGDWPWEVATAPVVAERAHAPGYAVLLWFVAQIGRSEMVIRLLSVLAHLASGFLLYRLVAGASGRRVVGVLAAVLGLLAPLAMRYARDATPYSVVGLLSVLSTVLLHRALITNDRRAWAAYVCGGVLSFYVHYFAVFLLVGHALAVVTLWVLGGRGAAWSARLAKAAAAFGGIALAAALWGPEVVRAFLMSAEDNQVTQAVYPVAPSFAVYMAEHLRVLLAIPDDLPWLAVPVALTAAFGWTRLYRDRTALALIVGIPFLLVTVLLATVYVLHDVKFGGRMYFGWRWLRPFGAAVAIPLAWALPTWRPEGARGVLATVGVGLAVVLCAVQGGASALRRERPAQDVAAAQLLGAARDADAIGVLPAPFYTVGWSYYLHGGALKYIHPGPSIWDYYGREEGDGRHSRRVFGPIRSFGLPLESIATHSAIRRLWVTVFRERLFGHPEFDEQLTEAAIAHLDRVGRRVNRWLMPFIELYLYEMPVRDPWAGGSLTVDTARLYRSLAWLPRALDPDYFLQTFRGDAPIDLRLAAPPSRVIDVLVTGLPPDAADDAIQLLPMPRADHPGEARLQPPPATIERLSGGLANERRFKVTVGPHPQLELRVERTRQTVQVPLRIEMRPALR